MVDEDDDRQSRIYEFVSTPSYVSLLSYNSNDPVYFVLVEKKGQATEKLQDRYGHVILPGELYLEGRYLHKSSKARNSKFWTILFTLAQVKFLKHLLSLMMIQQWGISLTESTST